ncbi:AAA family ATPase [Aestuariimicrobium sp. Y1814]|uniref:AAA family ATPase n=1 Tax=Aestuariimicrobium sp. Y1814 TaxID=3418742 RepID=UPI003DA76D7A
MTLLSFTVSNHKSVRDEAVLDLTIPGWHTLHPHKGRTWAQSALPVAGIFGPNASGKSNVIDALHYALSAVQASATEWLGLPAHPYEPFALVPDDGLRPSRYEFDFVVEGIRHRYGFAMDESGVTGETLEYLPSTRWRQLISRDTRAGTLTFHTSLGAPFTPARRELILSRATVLEHPQLSDISRALTEGIDVSRLGDNYRQYRLQAIIEALSNGVLDLDGLATLLSIADVGIQKASLREDELTPEAVEMLAKIREIFPADSPNEAKSLNEQVRRSLEFTHAGATDRSLPLQVESSGTVAWLALIVPAVDALRNGGLLVVDEIDSSLHSHLVEVVLGYFMDETVNRHGAQLIFTSHDTYLLGNDMRLKLSPEQVWFTEKDREGATSLFSLAEFPRHKDANVARRYLAGRYGATPSPAPSMIHRILDEVPATA